MESSIKKLLKSQLELRIEVSSEEFDNCIEKAILNLGKNLEIKGFRKGSAPKEIVEKEMGEEKILLEAANLAVKENYQKVVLDNKLEPISQPETTILKLAKGNPFAFQIKVTVLPQIEIPDYKKIAVQIKRNKTSVDEKDIEEALIWLQKSRAKFTPLQTPAAKGDFVEIEYQSPQMASAKALKDSFLLGQGRFMAGFEDNLIGMKTGEEKEFTIPFPKDYFKKELIGKSIDFKVKMAAVQKMELPEVNDDFARSLGKFGNLVKLKNNLKEGLGAEKESEETQRVRNEILLRIAENANIEIPEVLVDREKEELFNDLKRMINQNFKISYEEYLATTKQTEEDLKNSFLKEAQKKVKKFLILRTVGEKEKISVTKAEIDEEVNKAIKHYSPDKIKNLDLYQLREYTKEAIYNQKTLQKLEGFIGKIS